jgi:hypothetical protein
MTNLELKKEKSAKEMVAEGGGTIPVGWSIMSGTIGEKDEETFNVMLSGAKLYFSFSKGNRRISLDLTPAISDAYILSREE